MRAVIVGSMALSAAILLHSGASYAATMTFDAIPADAGDVTFSEDGILAVATGGEIASFSQPGAAHLDDGGSSLARSITFSMGQRFNAVGFDLLPVGFSYFVCTSGDGEAVSCTDATFDNVRLSGFRNGLLVAERVFDMGDLDRPVPFGTAFRNLDSVEIGVVQFFGFGEPGDPSFGFCEESPCSHFDIDNVTLAPVPLPAGIMFLGTALGILGAVRRRKPAACASH